MSVSPSSGSPPTSANAEVPKIAPTTTIGVRALKTDPAEMRTFKCRTVAKGRFSQLNYIRDLAPQPVIEDEPNASLADRLAPNAMEALLAALGSSLAMGINANAVAHNLPIRSLELALEADVNTTAVWGAGELSPKILGFETIRVQVRIDADASREALTTLTRHALLWSPVANTLHNPVHLDMTLAPD